VRYQPARILQVGEDRGRVEHWVENGGGVIVLVKDGKEDVGVVVDVVARVFMMVGSLVCDRGPVGFEEG